MAPMKKNNKGRYKPSPRDDYAATIQNLLQLLKIGSDVDTILRLDD
jgi:hypothetical protein